MAQGGTVAQASRQKWVTEQSFYRWRNEYGGLKIDYIKRLEQLELENIRLKRAISDLRGYQRSGEPRYILLMAASH